MAFKIIIWSITRSMVILKATKKKKKKKKTPQKAINWNIDI
jgi:hypothetical protein